MRRSLRCVFLTRYDADARRKEFVWAVKNCRHLKSGSFKDRGGVELAVELTLQRRGMVEFLRCATLVPVPPSGAGVSVAGDTLWPGRELAVALASALDLNLANLLHRSTPIEKSSGRVPVPRTLRRHVDSIEVAAPLPEGPIVLVDDVVASGATMCGCAELLLRVSPTLEIRGFAAAYAPAYDDEHARDFATRQYDWDDSDLEARPMNRLVDDRLSR